jgi:hypothetical protein
MATGKHGVVASTPFEQFFLLLLFRSIHKWRRKNE